MTDVKTIRIEQTGETQFSILLGDTDISAYVHGVTIELDPGQPPHVHLDCVAHRIELPADLKAIVTGSRDRAEIDAFMTRVNRGGNGR